MKKNTGKDVVWEGLLLLVKTLGLVVIVGGLVILVTKGF